jgi:hypothetical protein
MPDNGNRPREAAPPILLLGVARSGSTWIGQILGHAAEARYVHEPDNETHNPYALRAKKGLGRFPFLRPGDRAPRYEACWEGAFAGGEWPRRTRLSRRGLVRQSYAAIEAWCDPGRRNPVPLEIIAALAAPGGSPPRYERPIVKSVHALLSAEWVIRRWHPVPVVVRRHPLNLVASWRRVSLGDKRGESALEYTEPVRAIMPPRAVAEFGAPGGEPPPAEDRLAALAWRVGLLCSAREELIARLDQIVCVDHDELCRAPAEGLQSVAGRLGLEWTDACDRALQRAERPGEGFVTQRIAAEQPDRWRTRLSPTEVTRVEGVLTAFPRGPWFASSAP